MAMVPATAELQALAALWIAGPLGSIPTPPTVHLAKAPFTPSPGLDPATLTEADFHTYAAKTISAWGTVHADANGQQVFINTTPLDWTPTDSVAPNTIYGYWLLDSAGKLVQAETFTTPVPMNGPTNTLQLVIELGINPWRTTAVLLP